MHLFTAAYTKMLLHILKLPSLREYFAKKFYLNFTLACGENINNKLNNYWKKIFKFLPHLVWVHLKAQSLHAESNDIKIAIIEQP